MRTSSLSVGGLSLLLAASWLLPAQAQNNDFDMLVWHGGTLQSDVQLGFNLTGGGPGMSTFGGVISTRVGNGAASLFSNPAELGLLRSRQFLVDTQLRLSTRSFGLSGSDFLDTTELEDLTDRRLDDLNYPASEPRSYTDVENIGYGQRGGVPAFAMALPVHPYAVLALGASYPLATRLNLQMTGLETLLRAEEDTGEQQVDIKVLMNMGLSAVMSLRMNALSLGGAVRLPQQSYGQLGFGLALNRYNTDFEFSLRSDVNGAVILNNSGEYFFNDPSDPRLDPERGETSALYLNAQGHYEASHWGLRTSAFYQIPQQWLTVTAALNLMPKFELEDDQAFSESFLPVFIDVRGKLDPNEEQGEEDLFSLSRFDLARPNLTRQSHDTLGQTMTLTFPSSLTLGFDFGLGPHTIAINVTRYLSPLSLEYFYNKPRAFGKDLTYGTRLGFDFKFPDRLQGAAYALLPIRLLFLDIDGLLLQAFSKYTGYRNPHYRLGMGVAFGEGIVEGVSEGQSKDVISLPTPVSFSIGRQYTVLDQVDVGVLVLGFPDLAFRFSFAYTLRE